MGDLPVDGDWINLKHHQKGYVKPQASSKRIVIPQERLLFPMNFMLSHFWWLTRPALIFGVHLTFFFVKPSQYVNDG